MALRLTFQFFDTEAAAARFCMEYTREYPRRKKHSAHYTPWEGKEQHGTITHKFIAWYYI